MQWDSCPLCKNEISLNIVTDGPWPDTPAATTESKHEIVDEEEPIEEEVLEATAQTLKLNRRSWTAQEQDEDVGDKNVGAAAQIDIATAEQEGKWKSLLKGAIP